MKSQQAAEREEQQRIKNLVLNYDLHDDQHDGTPNGSPSSGPVMQPPLQRNPNTKGLKPGPDPFDRTLSRAERAGRHTARARRLNLKDVDWYGPKKSTRRGGNGGDENDDNFRTSTSEKSSLQSKKPG